MKKGLILFVTAITLALVSFFTYDSFAAKRKKVFDFSNATQDSLIKGGGDSGLGNTLVKDGK